MNKVVQIRDWMLNIFSFRIREVKVVILGIGVEVAPVKAAVANWTKQVIVVSSQEGINNRTINGACGLIVLPGFASSVSSWFESIENLHRQASNPKQFPPVVMLSAAGLHCQFDNIPEAGCPETQPCSTIVSGRAARLLLNRYPLHAATDVVFVDSIHILIVGFSNLAKAIALNIMRMAHYGLGKPMITVIDEQPEQCRLFMSREYDQAGQVAQLRFRSLDAVFEANDHSISSIYVCLPDAAENIRYAQNLRKKLSSQCGLSPKIYLMLDQFDSSQAIEAWDGQTVPFSALVEVCNPAILFGDNEDRLASIIHDYYLDSIDSQGRTWDATPSGDSWQSLPDSYKAASRHQGDHISAKLARIDCRSVVEDAADYFVFLPREVEQLSVIEHSRWSADRYVDGWRYGAERDNTQKLHPELIPYDDLTIAMKDLDRYAVRLVPALLGRQGRAVKRDIVMSVVNVDKIESRSNLFHRQVESVLARIFERYPDRVLVVVFDPRDVVSRQMANIASKKYVAVLRAFIREPVDVFLKKCTDSSVREEFLSLLACSEQIIQLNSQSEFIRWMELRSDISLMFHASSECEYSPLGKEVLANQSIRRPLLMDPVSGDTRWMFDY